MDKVQDVIIKQVPVKVLIKLEELRAKRGLRSRAELIRALLEEATKQSQ